MKISHLLILMRETKLSPEQMAGRLGISNMTIRRWMKKNSDEPIPAIYEKTVWDAVYQMVAEGILHPESTFARKTVRESQKLYFRAAMKSLGFKDPGRGKPTFSRDTLLAGLSQIGAEPEHRSAVEKDRRKIDAFIRMGQDWKERITLLLKVVSSSDLSLRKRFVAYGALFYLICPLDLIPDNVPVFGLMDDYCVLGFAAAHYSKKQKMLFG
jgi:uncharacterized membrane protein YkvA (DUF1232 family)